MAGQFYDQFVKNDDDLINEARYVVANHLRTDLVRWVGDYPYWHCIYF